MSNITKKKESLFVKTSENILLPQGKISLYMWLYDLYASV